MKHNTEGFTLIEIVLSTTLLAAVVVVIAAFSSFYFRNYLFSFQENLSTNQAQESITRMIREIREARNGEDGSWPIVQADDNSISFYSDITNDGRADKVRYFVDGTDLKKGVIQPTADPISYPSANEVITVLATPVDLSQGPVFTYYNGNWPGDTINNPLATADRVLNTRYIHVHVRITTDPGSHTQPFELSTGVQLRGLKNNL